MRWYYDGAVFRVLNFLLGLITLFLGLRILFRLVGANPETPFVQWIYSLSGILTAPFAGIFPNQSANGAVLDVVAMVALIMYAIAIYLIASLVDALMNRRVYRRQVEL
jgi:hypothetical protein